MALLVGYDSSDEDGEAQQPQAPEQDTRMTEREPIDEARHEPDASNQPRQTLAERHSSETSAAETKVEAKPSSPVSQPVQPTPGPQLGPSLPASSVPMGPSLPAADEAGDSSYPEEMDQREDQQEDQQEDQTDRPPSSPYTANRTLIHNLTLPTVADMDIPPSPPGSPTRSSAESLAQAALTVKFEKFLELKRKPDGPTHLSAKIAESHALKNPPLMDKLLGFVGVGTSFEEAGGGTDQYATTLPGDLWDPAGFPEWAFRRRLRKAQERVQRDQARERGQAVQFIPGVNPTGLP